MRMGEEEVVVSGEEEVEMEMEMESEERRRNEVAPPRVALRILLVEADDSTRQIIAALLRKCSYKGHFFNSCGFRFLFFHFLSPAKTKKNYVQSFFFFFFFIMFVTVSVKFN